MADVSTIETKKALMAHIFLIETWSSVPFLFSGIDGPYILHVHSLIQNNTLRTSQGRNNFYLGEKINSREKRPRKIAAFIKANCRKEANN